VTGQPEFSRPVRVDSLGPAPRHTEISAEAAERAALAHRLALPAIDRLSAELSLSRAGERVIARGRIAAAVAQSCVVTGEPVEAAVEEPFEVEFRPPPAADAEEEIELGGSELDVVFYEGAAIDVGELAAETLALGLDPYPRSPAAEQALKAAGVKSEEEARAESSPFAILKDKLGK
jgi:uncharacterized metal-binding protein YceD (DUF177 family)